ncbi:histamine H2 receptor-like [Paramuricea clavata]|uniref:Histamine H2 receptor-like n=1 Tax=Paramuricea clavata TaxID=317549 RepID=A0A6S7HR13_PARCT|nr:histamine H2 receptor-like [Paramuricea clavata]
MCYVMDDEAQVLTSFPTNESILVHIFALILIIILTFTTISLNGVTVFTIWRSRILRQKSSNFTILLQSVVDFANGVFIMPLITFHWASEAAGSPSCVAAYVVKKSAMLMTFYTLITLSVMNFDRYMGVLHPFVHRRVVTNERLLAYVIAVCTIQTVIYGFSVTHNKIMRPILVATTTLFIFTTVFVYFKIFLSIRSRNRVGVILVGKNIESDAIRLSRRDVSEKTSAENRSGKAEFLKELKAAKSSFLVVMCCLVCYVPGTLSFGPLNLMSSFLAVALKVWFVLLAMLNSTMNSIIYFWMNNMLRKLGKDMVKSMWNSLTRQV